MSREKEQVGDREQGLRDLMQGKCGGKVRLGKSTTNWKGNSANRLKKKTNRKQNKACMITS